MSSDNEVYIKTEVDDDSQDIDIQNFIKVEVDENSEFEEDFQNEDEIIRELVDDGLMLAENSDERKDTRKNLKEDLNDNIDKMKNETESLDCMKGKYNSQLNDYLRLAKIRQRAEHEHFSKKMLDTTTNGNKDDEKSIIPSRERQQIRRAEREELKKESDKLAQESQAAFNKASQQMINIRQSENVEDPKKVAHKKRKVQLERERRKGLTQLFDELDYWVDLGDKDESYQEARLNRFQKLPYYERTNAAIKCITNLESSISFKETVIRSLQARNEKLQKKLESLKGSYTRSDDQDGLSPYYEPLYSCEKCNLSHNNIQNAFIHSEFHTSSEKRRLPSKITTTPASVECMVYKCKYCPTVCLNSLALQIHKFLHQDLTYFFCPSPDCHLIFGVPSKLKRHYFLTHEKILGLDHHYILDMNSRMELTQKVQEYMTTSDPSKVEVVDNFFDASIDAKLVMDEISMNEEVENIPPSTLMEMLGEYLKMDTATNDEEEEICSEDIPEYKDGEFHELSYIKTEGEF